MMYVTILSVGNLREDYLQRAEAEYTKRLAAFCHLEQVTVREARISDEDNPAQIAAALEEEGEHLLARMPKGAYSVALCVEGVQYDSPTLARVLQEGAARGGRLCLIIGSSHGLSERVKAACDLRLSFSKLTFPHTLMRVLLGEVLYRSFSISAGRRYHK